MGLGASQILFRVLASPDPLFGYRGARGGASSRVAAAPRWYVRARGGNPRAVVESSRSGVENDALASRSARDTVGRLEEPSGATGSTPELFETSMQRWWSGVPGFDTEADDLEAPVLQPPNGFGAIPRFLAWGCWLAPGKRCEWSSAFQVALMILIFPLVASDSQVCGSESLVCLNMY